LYLSKLEIFGFKSFANKTVVHLTKGVTGIVGPNGCGKTNIVDAIRWCLGEQKSSTLRSDKMENVIFNGTTSKKPMGMAEVSLTLVNDRGVLPTEYSEVTITRRIFRSGESEYLLNGNLCRLKDITNLFMDTGMGTNAYSVIELKMIETILSNKAEERRNMFEEAAGVNKYKLRRRLALKKLEDVKADLTRVNDIYAEVEKKVNALERQASRADKYNQLNTVLREKEINLAEREYSYLNKKKTELKDRTQNYKIRKEEIDSEIKSFEEELNVYRDRINEIDAELKLKREEVTKQTEKLHTVQKNISVSEEREKSLSRNLLRFQQELEELAYTKEETEDILAESKELVNQYTNEIGLKETDIEKSAASTLEKENFLKEKREALKKKSDELIEIFKEINAKENLNNSLTDKFEKNKVEMRRIEERIQKITNNMAKTVGFLEDLSVEKVNIENKIEESEKLLASKRNEKETLERELSGLKDKELDEKSLLVNLENKIEFLQSLITNLEGVSKGAKTLLESEGWTDKEKTLFADVGSTEEKYRFALEASLKSVLNNMLIENTDDLNKAVLYLQKNDLGKASFYLLQNTKSSGLLNKLSGLRKNTQRKKIEKNKDFLGWAYLMVQTKPKWKPYFNKILNNTALAKDLDSAIKLSKIFPEFNYATLNGDLVQNNGIIEAGSLPKLDDTLFGRKQLLEELKLEYPKLQQNLEQTRTAISVKEELISGIDLNSISDQGRILLNEITSIEKQISQLEYENNKSSEEIEILQKQLQELAVQTNNTDDELTKLSEIIKADLIARKEAEDVFKSAEQEVREIETEYNSFVYQLNQGKLELERLKGKLQNTHNTIERSEQSLLKITETIGKRNEDISNTKEEITSLKSILEDYQFEFDELKEVQIKLENEQKEIEGRLLSVKDEALKLEKQLTFLRHERQKLSDELHEVDLKINQIDLKVENVKQNIKETYTIDVDLKDFEDEDNFNFEAEHQEVSSLKNRIKQLGPINLLAYSEFEEENERLQFFTKQRNDLIDAEKDLIKTIQEINNTAQTLFMDTFEAIRQNFIKIFRGLFNPGDEADLIIQEGVDPLEAKIEISAKPKGKRPTSIELLSGGEKTLTATALLFAIYLVKPSPFCILDEVDAPLDDANIDRFTKLIKEFSLNTQFIMVTHNKRTMEASENMYGVTMQEEGISKLVGVQFNEQLATA